MTNPPTTLVRLPAPPGVGPPSDMMAVDITLSPAATPATATPAATLRLGRYQITKLLGRGGMGCVYLGWDERLRRKVAVKVLPPELARDPESRARFLREARAAAAVTHDHIVTIYEAGQDGDTAYMAMQYLPGMTLHQYLGGKGRPAVPVAVRIAREVAAGLAAAHAAGLLHRDVKPSNVLLEAPKGRVKILDFGLAAPFAPDDPKLTQTGLVVGTPAYMSPEQARGWKTDHRTDLFSLGAVLYQLCTGRPPFGGPTTMDVLTALATEVPEPVGRQNPEVPPRLELLIERLLDKDPAGRPQTAAEVVADLRSIERDWVERRSGNVLVAETVRKTVEVVAAEVPDDPADEVIAAEPPTEKATRPRTKALGRRAQKRRQARQRQVFIAMAVGGLLVCLGIAGFAAVRLFPRTPPSTTPTAAPPTAPEEPTGEAFHPRDLPPGWPPGKQPPPWWRPGMPLPPEFRRPPK